MTSKKQQQKVDEAFTRGQEGHLEEQTAEKVGERQSARESGGSTGRVEMREAVKREGDLQRLTTILHDSSAHCGLLSSVESKSIPTIRRHLGPLLPLFKAPASRTSESFLLCM